MESSDFVPGASETGSLTAHSNEESQFVGSSSGVYFINTVRQAFSQNLNQSAGSSPSGHGFPQPEDTLVGSEDSPRDKHHAPASTAASPSRAGDSETMSPWKYAPAVSVHLGSAPPVGMAKELMMTYFKVWHPLFPFLHGPTFLQAMELLYSEDAPDTTAANQTPFLDHRNACWTTIFQCVFNLASFLRPDLHLPPESQIESPSSMYPLLGTLSCRHDIPSLQALLAAQLYLVARMSLRTASTVGGCILRSMLHAGLHRCPFRYKELSSHDRQLRKRIFWCAYAIDRYLSQALGLPLGIQDSDIDVCPPGAPEIHLPGIHGTQCLLLFGRTPSETNTSRSTRPDKMLNQETEDKRKREAALASYVESGKLTGQALELFHKSVLVRSIRRSSVLFLASDVHRWWNSLPRELQGNPAKADATVPAAPSSASPLTDKPFDFGPFFTVLYQHLILLINRPFLSLAPSTPEFCSALQTCIGAARGILAALRSQVDGKQELFWPGFLSAAWMSGLVLAFACQLKQYVLSKGSQEINECLEFLYIMSPQWETARHCHSALSLLFSNIRQSAQEPQGYRHRAEDEGSATNTNKKRRLDNNPSYYADGQEQMRPSLVPNPNLEEQQQQSTINPVSQSPEPNQELVNSYDPTSISADAATADNGFTEADNNRLFYFSDGTTSNPGQGPGLSGVGNFDLNMVDLFQAPSNFDSLFDLFGQQYPSF
ncbi:transcription factor domain-containing protein [Aspergillus chevalieri]|uniref:Xylanolytic transcriptional activator regulatory domain-containing protein n=1 Tax=Aspergillus chevalieri TaxID=182096 RepID=A0A7R7VG83_ASPCH|nr:uncharacterized protein ACHE_11592S [Aspergillus chevalieri]BCR84190.1 hypothetical protein ACHE_11592S [Aspergillus chevalieri]